MDDKSSHDAQAALEQLLAQSRSTDVPALLQAKEVAKRLARENPSSANTAALARVMAMLSDAEKTMSDMQTPDVFKSVGAVLRYLEEEKGRQIKKTKLYDDVKSGLLRKEDRTYRRIDVDRYAATLPLASTPDGRTEAAEERLRRSEEADIRMKEARADREERKNAIMAGQYVSRADVDQELAARAATLNQGLKSKFEAAALELVNIVGGKPKRARTLVQHMERLVDAACAEYAQAMEFEVAIYDFDDEEGDDAESGASA